MVVKRTTTVKVKDPENQKIQYTKISQNYVKNPLDYNKITFVLIYIHTYLFYNTKLMKKGDFYYED